MASHEDIDPRLIEQEAAFNHQRRLRLHEKIRFHGAGDASFAICKPIGGPKDKRRDRTEFDLVGRCCSCGTFVVYDRVFSANKRLVCLNCAEKAANVGFLSGLDPMAVTDDDLAADYDEDLKTQERHIAMARAGENVIAPKAAPVHRPRRTINKILALRGVKKVFK
jgi:hypothetical protein